MPELKNDLYSDSFYRLSRKRAVLYEAAERPGADRPARALPEAELSHILSTGGPTTLVVPVCRPSGERVPVRDIRIDRTKKWRHQHFQALVSAYRRSPYFSYYEERFAVVYRKRHDFLVDLNEELQSLVLELLRADPPVGHTERYAEHVPEGEDFRHCISRKPRLSRPDPDFAPQPYYQVFSERMPFVPNLSIVDLLFCEGPSAAGVLAASVPSAGVHPSLAR